MLHFQICKFKFDLTNTQHLLCFSHGLLWCHTLSPCFSFLTLRLSCTYGLHRPCTGLFVVYKDNPCCLPSLQQNTFSWFNYKKKRDLLWWSTSTTTRNVTFSRVLLQLQHKNVTCSLVWMERVYDASGM